MNPRMPLDRDRFDRSPVFSQRAPHCKGPTGAVGDSVKHASGSSKMLQRSSIAGVVKLADARDSKSRGGHPPCGFDSHLRHQITSDIAPWSNRQSAKNIRLVPKSWG